MTTRTNRTIDFVDVLRTIPRSSLPIGVAWAKCEEAADEIERLRRERDEATRYAENLAVALSRHFPHVPQWKPLTGDLIGLLTQIDNMTAGLSPARAALGEEKKS